MDEAKANPTVPPQGNVVSPTETTPIATEKKHNSWLVIGLLILLIVSIGIAGYFVYQNYQLKKQVEKVQTTPVSYPTTLPTVTTSITQGKKEIVCTKLDETVTNFEYCKILSARKVDDYIKGPNGIKINHATSYSVSPNKKRVFVLRVSATFANEPGAPTEEALSMINLETNLVYELFSQIYFVNFLEKESWSKDGLGIVFSAGEQSNPPLLEGSNPFAVVYCETTCRVLAKNAGPQGIGGDPAYFKNGLVHYSRGENGDSIDIPFQ